jgi:hypothetical protein
VPSCLVVVCGNNWSQTHEVKLHPGMTTLQPVVQCRSVVRYVGPRLLPISNRALSGTTAGLVSSGFFFFCKLCSKPAIHRLPDGYRSFSDNGGDDGPAACGGEGRETAARAVTLMALRVAGTYQLSSPKQGPALRSDDRRRDGRQH